MNPALPLQSFKVSEPIKAGMVVAYNHYFPANEPRVQRAHGDDDIVGVAVHDSDINDMISIAPLVPGIAVKVLAGAEFSAGDLIGLKPIDASSAEAGYVYPIDQTVAVAIKLVALEHANEGELFQAIGYTCPSIAPKAYALDTNGQYVGGPDKHMYFLPTGIPVNSSATIGSDSTPIYMQGGKFKACTSAGGGAGEYVHLAELSTRDAVKSFILGATTGQQVKGYVMHNVNTNVFTIMWSLPEGQTQPMIVVGSLHNFYNTSDTTVKLPDVPVIVRVAPGVSLNFELRPEHYGNKMGNRAEFDCMLFKA